MREKKILFTKLIFQYQATKKKRVSPFYLQL